MTEEEKHAAQKAGANQRAVQLLYRLPKKEHNPYSREDPLHDEFHFGYEMERAISG